MFKNLNKKKLWSGPENGRRDEVIRKLQAAKIEYTIEVPALSVDAADRCEIYVNKSDYEKADFLIRGK